jgi:hypothetical protein
LLAEPALTRYKKDEVEDWHAEDTSIELVERDEKDAEGTSVAVDLSN